MRSRRGKFKRTRPGELSFGAQGAGCVREDQRPALRVPRLAVPQPDAPFLGSLSPLQICKLWGVKPGN